MKISRTGKPLARSASSVMVSPSRPARAKAGAWVPTGSPAVVPPAFGHRRPALRAGFGRLVRSGAAADGHGTARRRSVLGNGGRAADARHRRRHRRVCAFTCAARHQSDRRPPPVARSGEEWRARPAAARPARAAAKRLHHALAGRLSAVIRRGGAVARYRLCPLAGRAAAQPLRHAIGRRDSVLAPGVER